MGWAYRVSIPIYDLVRFQSTSKASFNAWAISKGIQAWRDENMVNT